MNVVLKSENIPHFDIKSGLQINVLIENYFSYFSTKTHVIGTQKHRLNETLVFLAPNIRFDC